MIELESQVANQKKLFVKPNPRKVKTRLAKLIGDKAALEAYKELTQPSLVVLKSN